jgi:hypothetical protein
MAYTIVDQIRGYSDKVKRALYVGAKTSVLVPTEAIFKPEFNEIAVRQVKSVGGAADYNGSFDDTAGGTTTVEWKTYTASNDRMKVFKVDGPAELASFLAGTKASILEAYENYCEKDLAAEMDAVTMANLTQAAITAGVTPETLQSNTLSFADLNKIEADLFDAGVDGEYKIYAFVRSDLYTGLENDLLNKNGLANPAVIKPYTVEIPSDENEDDVLVIETRAIQYNSFVIIRMPKNRMYSKVTLLDGKTAGQTNGGYTAASDAKELAALFVPEGTAFVQSRWNIANIMVPAAAYDVSQEIEINEMTTKLMSAQDKQVVLEHIGVNQSANAFQLNSRTIYDAHAFDINADKILPIYAAEVSPTPTSTSSSTN